MLPLEIHAALQQNTFLEETIDQLEKDFLMVGIHFDIEQPVHSFHQVFQFTYTILNTLNERDPSRLVNLLYRIDLPEEKIKEEMQNTELTFIELISDMLVKRELYKVILRKRFS